MKILVAWHPTDKAIYNGLTVRRVVADANIQTAQAYLDTMQEPTTGFVYDTDGAIGWEEVLRPFLSNKYGVALFNALRQDEAAITCFKHGRDEAVRRISGQIVVLAKNDDEELDITTVPPVTEIITDDAPQPKAERSKRIGVSKIMEEAAKGNIPDSPDFSANTHKAYRKKLAALVALVNDRDIAGLENYDTMYKIKPSSTSPRALLRYRDAALTAIRAQGPKE